MRNGLVVLLALLLPAACLADDALALIRERGVLRVGIKNQGANVLAGHKDPAHFLKRNFEIELAHAIAARLLGDPALVELSTRRKPERLAAVANGEVDLGISMLRVTPEAARLVDFSTPYYESGLAVLELADSRSTSLADLSGKSIALVVRNDDDLAERITRVMPDGTPPPTIVGVASFADGVSAIDAGQVDGLVSEAINIDAFLAGQDGALRRSAALTHERYAVAVAHGNLELLAVVNAVIADLAHSGELAAMRRNAGLAPLKQSSQ